MNILAYEFSAAQRRVMDRYTAFLGTLEPTFTRIAGLLALQVSRGHRPAALAADSRLNNAPFNECYLLNFWGRTEDARRLCSRYIEDLTTFTRETREITSRTSRSEPISQVDFKLYSLSRSPTWKLFPPTNLPQLIHELTLRFYELSAEIRQLKYTIAEVHDEAFGLKSVFFRAMDHRACQCHTQPTVVQALFREAFSTPVWDVAYTSADPAVRAAEYKSGVAELFNEIASVSSQASVFLEEAALRIDAAIDELLRAERVSKLGELNFQLTAAKEGADEFMAMVSHFETWLRK